ncbi:MAG: efflux RND transporter periplasmic adaptor subunit [Leadbetterella sp.]|nr:efflux RND transporter periplasmic adaptor subunit [Leadbetterella sp.]
MKRILITILVLAGFGGAIAYILSKNKKENQAKVDVVNASGGAVPVKVANAEVKPIDLDFVANGNFVPNQDLEFMSEVSGRITSLRVKEGDRVGKGQILATVEDKYLALDLQNAKEQYQKLLTDKNRLESALKTGGVTQAQVDEINLAVKNAQNGIDQIQKRIGDVQIKAPISGIINKKYIELGSYASPGTKLFDLVDVSSLKLNVNVNEKQVVQLKKGDKVDIKIPVFPDKTFSGYVSFISVKADNSLNFPIEIKLNPTGASEVKSGMYASANFNFAKTAPILTVPRTAFVGSVRNGQVYVVNGNKVTLTRVTPGSIFGDNVEILSGLSEGQTVVISGQINLQDGVAIEIQK